MRAIVTRPAQEAQSWVARLQVHGIDAVALPLIAIDPVPDAAPLRAAWQRLHAYRAVMFVSANAVRHFFARAPAAAEFVSCAWAPGPATAQALQDAGVPAARIAAPAPGGAQFDSEALWQRVAPQVRPGDRVLLVRGGDAQGRPRGREWLGEQVLAAGAEVETVVAYLRRLAAWTAAERELARRASGDGSVWLFSSSQGPSALGKLLPGQGWQAARALTTHPRIAAAARELGFGDVRECRPTLAEVVASLQSAR